MGTRGKPRIEARERGDKYYEGKACKICGATTRYASTSALRCESAHRWEAMSDEERQEHYEKCRETTREWARKWRAANREKWNKYHRDLRRKRGEKQRTYMREYMREYRKRKEANG